MDVYASSIASKTLILSTFNPHFVEVYVETGHWRGGSRRLSVPFNPHFVEVYVETLLLFGYNVSLCLLYSSIQ
jgi:hypothetical protein